MDVSWLPAAKVTLMRPLALSKALSPMDVTHGEMGAMPVQRLLSVTTLSVIVNVPLIEHGMLSTIAACATVPFNPNNIILIKSRFNIR